MLLLCDYLFAAINMQDFLTRAIAKPINKKKLKKVLNWNFRPRNAKSALDATSRTMYIVCSLREKEKKRKLTPLGAIFSSFNVMRSSQIDHQY